MIKDEDLKQAADYSEGQKTAAYMILGEIANLLGEFSDNLRIIGGWVPIGQLLEVLHWAEKWKSICEADLSKMIEESEKKRHDDKPCILTVDAKRAWNEGIKFYLGNEKVWLADAIPSKYIKG